MHGNAAEWAVPADGAANAIARGGSWYDRPFRCTAASRVAYAPHQRVFNTGFRVVVEN
jgi:formylglycine-generating enzyme required for sulfatase activity